jgi:hypothetical protein
MELSLYSLSLLLALLLLGRLVGSSLGDVLQIFLFGCRRPGRWGGVAVML